MVSPRGNWHRICSRYRAASSRAPRTCRNTARGCRWRSGSSAPATRRRRPLNPDSGAGSAIRRTKAALLLAWPGRPVHTFRVRHRSPSPEPATTSRRTLLGVALAAPALWVAGAGRRTWADELPATRELSLLNTHTGESLLTRYFEAGQYIPQALSKLDHLLRDHRSGDAHPIDPQLFDVLFHVAQRNARAPQFEIISGYR